MSSLVLLAVVALIGCGSGNGAGSAPGDYAGDPDLDPAGVVTAYVRALDERDGARFCELVAPYISGRFDLATRDPDSLLRDMDGCPEVVSTFIGYVDDCCPPQFVGGKVEQIDAVERHGELRMVRARVRVQLVESHVPRTETVDDVVWVARFDGAWRVAKLDEVARIASIRLSSDGPETSAKAPPDVAEEQRAFAAQLGKAEQRSEEREASYQPPGELSDCSGGASLADPEGDQYWNGAATKSGDPPRVSGGDLVGVDVAAQGETVCVRWRLAGTPEPPVALKYIHRGPGASGFFQPFTIELREDGTARVTSFEDDDGRPLSVPAEVGADGSSVSVVLDRDSFRAGQAGWSSHRDPPLEGFGFSVTTIAAAGEASSVLDDLGSAPSATFGYPDGGLCALEGC